MFVDESGDEIDGLLPHGVKGLMGKTRVDKMIVYWVSFLDGLQRVLLFTQDERIASSIRKVGVICVLVVCPFVLKQAIIICPIGLKQLAVIVCSFEMLGSYFTKL